MSGRVDIVDLFWGPPAPVGAGQVEVQLYDNDSTYRPTTLTAADGTFRFEDVPLDDEYSIYARWIQDPIGLRDSLPGA